MTNGEPSVAVYLGLGSNLGDRLANLRQAIDLMSNRVTVVRHSPVYETEPVGVPDQGRFLNMVVEAQTSLSPDQLMRVFKGIERELGRGNAASDAPRPIDIDILFYDDRIVSTESITLPHPRLAQRAFVLVPLNDLNPQLLHPVNLKTVAEMLTALDTTRGVVLYSRSLS